MAVGILGSDLLLLLAIALSCNDAMARGPIHLGDCPGAAPLIGGVIIPGRCADARLLLFMLISPI